MTCCRNPLPTPNTSSFFLFGGGGGIMSSLCQAFTKKGIGISRGFNQVFQNTNLKEQPGSSSFRGVPSFRGGVP